MNRFMKESFEDLYKDIQKLIDDKSNIDKVKYEILYRVYKFPREIYKKRQMILKRDPVMIKMLMRHMRSRNRELNIRYMNIFKKGFRRVYDNQMEY